MIRRRLHRHGTGRVYATLGSKVTVIEAMEGILAGADPGPRASGRPLRGRRYFVKCASRRGVEDFVGGRRSAVSEHDGKTWRNLYDRVLVSVGRVPNGQGPD